MSFEWIKEKLGHSLKHVNAHGEEKIVPEESVPDYIAALPGSERQVPIPGKPVDSTLDPIDTHTEKVEASSDTMNVYQELIDIRKHIDAVIRQLEHTLYMSAGTTQG